MVKYSFIFILCYLREPLKQVKRFYLLSITPWEYFCPDHMLSSTPEYPDSLQPNITLSITTTRTVSCLLLQCIRI